MDASTAIPFLHGIIDKTRQFLGSLPIPEQDRVAIDISTSEEGIESTYFATMRSILRHLKHASKSCKRKNAPDASIQILEYRAYVKQLHDTPLDAIAHWEANGHTFSTPLATQAQTVTPPTSSLEAENTLSQVEASVASPVTANQDESVTAVTSNHDAENTSSQAEASTEDGPVAESIEKLEPTAAIPRVNEKPISPVPAKENNLVEEKYLFDDLFVPMPGVTFNRRVDPVTGIARSLHYMNSAKVCRAAGIPKAQSGVERLPDGTFRPITLIKIPSTYTPWRDTSFIFSPLFIDPVYMGAFKRAKDLAATDPNEACWLKYTGQTMADFLAGVVVEPEHEDNKQKWLQLLAVPEIDALMGPFPGAVQMTLFMNAYGLYPVLPASGSWSTASDNPPLMSTPESVSEQALVTEATVAGAVEKTQSSEELPDSVSSLAKPALLKTDLNESQEPVADESAIDLDVSIVESDTSAEPQDPMPDSPYSSLFEDSMSEQASTRRTSTSTQDNVHENKEVDNNQCHSQYDDPDGDLSHVFVWLENESEVPAKVSDALEESAIGVPSRHEDVNGDLSHVFVWMKDDVRLPNEQEKSCGEVTTGDEDPSDGHLRVSGSKNEGAEVLTEHENDSGIVHARHEDPTGDLSHVFVWMNRALETSTAQQDSMGDQHLTPFKSPNAPDSSISDNYTLDNTPSGHVQSNDGLRTSNTHEDSTTVLHSSHEDPNGELSHVFVWLRVGSESSSISIPETINDNVEPAVLHVEDSLFGLAPAAETSTTTSNDVDSSRKRSIEEVEDDDMEYDSDSLVDEHEANPCVNDTADSDGEDDLNFIVDLDTAEEQVDVSNLSHDLEDDNSDVLTGDADLAEAFAPNFNDDLLRRAAMMSAPDLNIAGTVESIPKPNEDHHVASDNIVDNAAGSESNFEQEEAWSDPLQVAEQGTMEVLQPATSATIMSTSFDEPSTKSSTEEGAPSTSIVDVAAPMDELYTPPSWLTTPILLGAAVSALVVSAVCPELSALVCAAGVFFVRSKIRAF